MSLSILYSDARSYRQDDYVYEEYEYQEKDWSQYNDYHWQNADEKVEERGESFWRSKCREWSADEIYLQGDKVEHGGKFYVAQWWTSNNVPGGEWGAWQLIGASGDGEEDSEEESDEEEGQDESIENEIDNSNKWEHKGPNGPPSLKEAEQRETELTDSPLFNMVKASIATLPSSKVDQITSEKGASNPANVRRVQSIMSEDQYDFLFAVRDKAYTYTRY